MTLPVHFLFETNTDFAVDVQARPSATQTFQVMGSSGGVLVAATNGTLSTISTTLNGAVTEGARSVVVASATGISSGREFWVRDPSEKLLCRTVSGTTVTLARPVTRSHATGVTVEGTRISGTATCGSLFWDGQVKWLIDDGQSTELHFYQHAICTRYPFYRVATEQDLFDEEPLMFQLLDGEQDAQRLLDTALAEVVRRVAARTEGKAWAYSGPHQFITATVLAALMKHYRGHASDSATILYDRYRLALDGEIDRLMSFVRADTDQDQIAELDEKRSGNSVRMFRS